MDYSNSTDIALLRALADPNEINLNPIWNELVRRGKVKGTDDPQQIIAKYRRLFQNQSTVQDAQQTAETANARIAEHPQRSSVSVPKKTVRFHETGPLDGVVEGPSQTFTVPKTPIAHVPTEELLETVANPQPTADSVTGARSSRRPTRTAVKSGWHSPIKERDPGGYGDYWDNYTAPKPPVEEFDPGGYSDYWDSYTTPKIPATTEALVDDLAESATTPTPRTPAIGILRDARQAEFDSLSEHDRGLLNALSSPDSDLGNLTGGVPEGFVKPERIGATRAYDTPDISTPKARLSGIGESVANAVDTAPTDPRTFTFGSGGLRGTGVSSDAIGLSKPKGVRGMGGGTSGGLTGLFGNIFGGGGANNPANARVAGASQARAGRGIFAPGFGAKVQEGLGKLSDPQLNWTKGTGLKAYGHNIGGLASTAQGLYGAYQIADALSENTKAKNTTEDITSDILTAAAGNPMAAYDLTADQKRLLGELKRGSYEDSSDMGSLDWGAGLAGALKGGAAGFLGGGTTGAIVGALSSGVPAAMRGIASEQERKNAELEALYAALSESDARFRDARRQKAMRMYY